MGAALDTTFALADVLVCPQCRGDLRTVGVALHVCVSCGVAQPPVGELACLLRDRSEWSTRWRRQLGVLASEGARTVAMFEAEARKPALLGSTRTRLHAQAGIAKAVLDELLGILRPVVGVPIVDEGPVPFAALDTLHFLHRDWGWPESDENERAFELLARVLPARLGRVLVLGAGACRLAYDLHRHGAAFTCAVDIDPLVLTLARRVLAGERVPLVEGRANATELARLSVARTLALPPGSAPAPEIELLLADGCDPPFRDGMFDTVVTPWFIDVVPPDLRELLPRVRRLLAEGGHWVDFGPLLYPNQRASAVRFSREEVFELAARAGLGVEDWCAAELPFAHSPLTERGRIESCLAMRARAGEPSPARPGDPPSWAIFPSLPVPALQSQSRTPTTRAAQRIAALANGRTSIDDIAATLAPQLQGTELAAIKDAIRMTLMELHGC